MLKKNFINLNKVKFNASFPDESTIVTYTENNTPLSFLLMIYGISASIFHHILKQQLLILVLKIS